tara:strand:+ start:446 stop:700 length:255 start_codon:yes stop_codon:yes gene_type:complete
MNKPKINNLIAKVQGRDLTLHQCADATRELNKMILYTEELEQLILSGVSHQRELFFALLRYTMPEQFTDVALKNIVKGFIEQSK